MKRTQHFNRNSFYRYLPSWSVYEILMKQKQHNWTLVQRRQTIKRINKLKQEWTYGLAQQEVKEQVSCHTQPSTYHSELLLCFPHSKLLVHLFEYLNCLCTVCNNCSLWMYWKDIYDFECNFSFLEQRSLL